uniref:Uncharacterized protein n=1 Tax=Pristionchus pacificus TaxID=54126 RepID=A0A2A6CDV0_PRIPA|eukprot:PDM76289.1 hypothetical protein PRIPAC_39893 [Pristionchus pacificus]
MVVCRVSQAVWSLVNSLVKPSQVKQLTGHHSLVKPCEDVQKAVIVKPVEARIMQATAATHSTSVRRILIEN